MMKYNHGDNEEAENKDDVDDYDLSLGHLVIMEAAVTTVPEYVLTFSATWGGGTPLICIFW